MLLFVLLILALFVLVVGYGYYVSCYWRRRGVSGPPSQLFIGNLKHLDVYKKPIAYQLAEWTKEYGSVYGIQRGCCNALVVSDPKLAHEVMHEKFDCFYARDISPLNGNPDKNKVSHVFFARGPRWKRLRSLTSLAFTAKNLKKIYPIITACAYKLCQNLDEDLEKSSIIDFAFNLKEFTADIILRSAFNRHEDREYIQGLIRGILATFNHLRGFVFKAGWVFPPLGRQLGAINRWIGQLFKAKPAEFILQTRRDINERKKLRDANPDSVEEPRDFIDVLMESQSDDVTLQGSTEFDKKSVHIEKKLTVNELFGTSLMFLIAGFDPIANSLSFTVYYLALNPEVQEKLRQEIFDICGEDAPIDNDSLAKMKYSEAVMKETLRFSPISASSVSRRCMKETTLGGIKIEPGTDVILDSITLQRDPATWGDDSNEFKPERWLDPNVPSQQFVAFGDGLRICVGMRLAYMEQKVAVATLLRRYRIHEIPETRTEHFVTGNVLTPKNVKVRLERL